MQGSVSKTHLKSTFGAFGGKGESDFIMCGGWLAGAAFNGTRSICLTHIVHRQARRTPRSRTGAAFNDGEHTRRRQLQHDQYIAYM